MTITAINWQLNPLNNVIIGFRNHVFEDTRSRYVSFSIKEQPDMCRLLLKIAKKKLLDDELLQFPEHIVKQLIRYGFFKPENTISSKQKIKNKLNLLNENRNTRISYKNTTYNITSFIFMAFNSQKPGEFLRETVILPHWSPKFADIVFQLSNKEKTINELIKLSRRTIKRLKKHGVIIKSDESAPFNKFFNQQWEISNSLFAAVPPYSYALLPKVAKNEPLMVKNTVYITENSKIPPALSDKVYNFDWAQKNLPSFWIEDSVTHILSMYWIEKKHQTLLKRLINHEISAEELDEPTRSLFVQLYILESETSFQMRKDAWKKIISKAKQDLTEKKCFTLNDILHPVQLAMIRKYINYMLDNKYLLPDKANGSTKRRYWQHRDDVTFYIQSQICTIINQILPEPVKIGHNALAVYEPGAVLPKHKDDVLAFSWVMSLAIDTNPILDREQAWPIYVELDNDKKECALLRMGDGHLINPQMSHWRDELKDHSLGILFLWFVPANYQGYVNGAWIA